MSIDPPPRIIVHGWYGRGNVGDELMLIALRRMLAPGVVVVGQTVDAPTLSSADALVIGGGSLLDGAPAIDEGAEAMLLRGERPVFYVGVGAETTVHPTHQRLMLVARIVALRSHHRPSWLQSNVETIPDLVRSLNDTVHRQGTDDRVTCIPNVEVMPRWSDPHWKHLAWDRFKDELAQALDVAVERWGLRPRFLTMCQNAHMDDVWAAYEVLARMNSRGTMYPIERMPSEPERALESIGRGVIITQRYHGAVLATMVGAPTIVVAHHDKLRALEVPTNVIGYYELTKDAVLDAIDSGLKDDHEPFIAPGTVYTELGARIVRMTLEEKERRGR